MRRAPLALIVVAACAQGGAVPTEQPQPPPGQCKEEFVWSYDPALGSVEGASDPVAVDTTCPPFEQLAVTKTALFSKPKLLRKFVGFCVDVAGKTKSVAPVDPGGDETLDKVLVETVQRWTFTPAELGGQKAEACSKVRFDLRFE